jgi:hypothetical protein
MKTRLRVLKENYTENSRNINAIEQLLNNLVEADLKESILRNKKFEVLNDEKMTSHFSALTKICSSDDKISDICNDNGADFSNTKDRAAYIESYYKEVYKKPPTPPLEQNCIQNFLGDVAAHPTVTGAKLTFDEQQELDRPLSLDELEKSIQKANMKSAPGADGISNIFILHFWDLLKQPLLKYAQKCFETGHLSDSFRRAKIRLIPKKGNKNL